MNKQIVKKKPFCINQKNSHIRDLSKLSQLFDIHDKMIYLGY